MTNLTRAAVPEGAPISAPSQPSARITTILTILGSGKHAAGKAGCPGCHVSSALHHQEIGLLIHQATLTAQLLPGTGKNIQGNTRALITAVKTIARYRTRSFLNEYLSSNTLQEAEKKKGTFRQNQRAEELRFPYEQARNIVREAVLDAAVDPRLTSVVFLGSKSAFSNIS